MMVEQSSSSCADDTKNPVVSLKGVTKRFGKVVANDNITLDIYPGCIKALLGENGAGKSTLMSMLAGRFQPDEGTIEVDGEPVAFTSAKDGIRAGIGMVYQHFMLVHSMTVAENVLLGQTKSSIVSPAEMEKEIAALAQEFGLEIDPAALVADLSMGERQRVEILKLLYRKSRVLIFDEPTSVLTEVETVRLYESLQRMAAQGKAIVFISHKLEEVLALADDIAVLRRGRVEARFDRSEVTSKAELARRMVGKDVLLEISKEPVDITDVVLDIKNLTGLGLHDINLTVRKGEIVAVVGVAGNGQKALVEAVCGMQKPPADTVFIMGKAWRKFFSDLSWKKSLSYVPEDRLGLAVAEQMDLVDNLLLTTRKGFSKGPWLNRKRAAQTMTTLMEKHDIYPRRIQSQAWQLSGGNLQKMVISRELYRQPCLVVAEQPTQGLDVSATEAVWQKLLKTRQMAGILLVTGDLNEALQLADRIAVIFEGRFMDIFPITDREKVDKIGLMMAGVQDEDTV
ncbi:ABC transporter ATP-binding protein [Desulfovibrio inopinatus]|uniref:ABC transporter ATP-binding protein n=1 Tax=Desulfovibrio inopinatus TaxID=102109 RepID=UPI00040872E6|nr:ABC transporter ATP-binding protein [Desulfovibrio inopinatus]